jgi:hypothetical protein
MVAAPSGGFVDRIWFGFDTAQLVEWPVTAQSWNPFLQYAPNCARFAVQTDTSTIQVFEASTPQGPAIASLPLAGVLPTPDDFNWSPDGTLIAYQWNGEVRVASFGSAFAPQTIPGDYTPPSNPFYWRYTFGAERDWVSFQSVVAGQGTTPAAWFRWFSTLDGATPRPAQKFPTTIGSFPSESPDHSRIALLSDAGLAVTTLNQGAFSAPRSLLPLDQTALLSAIPLRWSADSTHVVTVTNVSNANYTLHVVDAIADPPESVAIPILYENFQLQP